jgi:formylglycine-generating enzyme required for sulfatase activity
MSSRHVLRGGSYRTSTWYLRYTFSGGRAPGPENRDRVSGFRVVVRRKKP